MIIQVVPGIEPGLPEISNAMNHVITSYQNPMC